MKAENTLRYAIGRGYYSHEAEASIIAKAEAAALAGDTETLQDIEDEAYMIGGVLAHRKFDANPIPWDDDKSPAANMGLE